MIKIAVDVQVSPQVMDALCLQGYLTLVRAAEGESDHSWFGRAVDQGVQIIITPDHEVRNWAHAHDIHTLELPQNLGGTRLSNYLLKKLARLKRKL